ncbi:hypothetical protein SAMD00079811_78430 (plasmid) [Scytonema sp. HK-05]|nr:hypothetical protein NIES2130_24785 [Scytonema sp. HK-05]BAY50214.1 hypothetical protein SAMD00079811_78430 [Scytonema sp. HK-05]
MLFANASACALRERVPKAYEATAQVLHLKPQRKIGILSPKGTRFALAKPALCAYAPLRYVCPTGTLREQNDKIYLNHTFQISLLLGIFNTQISLYNYNYAKKSLVFATKLDALTLYDLGLL